MVHHIVFVPQPVSQATQRMEWNFRGDRGHALFPNPDHGFGDPLQATFDGIDSYPARGKLLKRHAAEIVGDISRVVDDIQQAILLTARRH